MPTKPIDVKTAISLAKAYVGEVFADEVKTKPSLEEVWFDERENVWCVTVGVRHRTELNAVLKEVRRVDYKTVRIDPTDGKVLSVRNYEVAA